jgi:hypothetical protein
MYVEKAAVFCNELSLRLTTNTMKHKTTKPRISLMSDTLNLYFSLKVKALYTEKHSLRRNIKSKNMIDVSTSERHFHNSLKKPAFHIPKHTARSDEISGSSMKIIIF